MQEKIFYDKKVVHVGGFDNYGSIYKKCVVQGGAEVLAPGTGGRGDRGDAQVTINPGGDNIVAVLSQSSNFIKLK